MNHLHLLATILFSLILGATTFSYKDSKNWGKEYPKCDGRNQSPITIRPNYNQEPILSYLNTSHRMTLKDFYKFPTKMAMKNTGHTVEIKADWSGEPPSVSGGPLPQGKYVFEKATFRWGEKNNEGGEHKIYESKLKEIFQEDMEMHMYFYRKDFKSFEKAQSQKGGLAVLVKWLKVVSESEFEVYTHVLKDSEKSLSKLKKSLEKVKNINSTAAIPPFALTSIVYKDDAINEFMFYEGSLDHPPCWESVSWFIDQDDTIITDTMLNEFRKIKLIEGDVSNIRPTQPLNNREVKIVNYQ